MVLAYAILPRTLTRANKTVPKLRYKQQTDPLQRFWMQIKVSATFQTQQLPFYTQLPKVLWILKINAKMTTHTHTHAQRIINLLSAVKLAENMAEATSVMGVKMLAIKP